VTVQTTRRGFLQAVAAAPLAAAHAAAPRAPVIDAHLHCFAGKDSERFPYHERAPYKPDRPATPQHLLKCMDGAGVAYAIVVHPEPYQDDHRYLEYCLEVGKGRLKGTCLFFADRGDSAAKMAALARKLPLVAARVHAYAPDRLPPLGKPELTAFWKAVGDAGLAVQLHLEPRYAPHFEPLIKEFSTITVIIDHLGRPFQGTPQEHEVVVRWSRFKNAVMKLSSIPSKEQYPHRDVGPVIRRLADAYGADRMIYGGGFGDSATPESYRAARERARSYVAHLSADDQAKVLGGTAARLFGFAARP
jgi:predicted TIM-barrel fold metal-dependent hydrolase